MYSVFSCVIIRHSFKRKMRIVLHRWLIEWGEHFSSLFWSLHLLLNIIYDFSLSEIFFSPAIWYSHLCNLHLRPFLCFFSGNLAARFPDRACNCHCWFCQGINALCPICFIIQVKDISFIVFLKVMNIENICDLRIAFIFIGCFFNKFNPATCCCQRKGSTPPSIWNAICFFILQGQWAYEISQFWNTYQNFTQYRYYLSMLLL